MEILLGLFWSASLPLEFGTWHGTAWFGMAGFARHKGYAGEAQRSVVIFIIGLVSGQHSVST